MLLDRLPLSPGAGPPRGHGSLVKPKGDHDRLQGTAMRQEREHEGDGFGWRPQAVEGRAVRGTERLVTRRAEPALVLARMDANVTLAGLASGGAGHIRAECRSGVHACTLRVALGNVPRGSMPRPHFHGKHTIPRLSVELPTQDLPPSV